MAVLLAESIKSGEKFIGKLEDKLLLDKLLGPKGQDDRNRAILKASAIFNFFGYSGDLISQVEFIAKNKHITSLNGDDTVIVNEFHEVCQYYLAREIFEQKGRFIGMRPFPLAMSLAQEWLEPCTPQRLLDVITAIAQLEMPDKHDLSEALSERMKYLGYNDKAIQIVESIIGSGSPFDNAEVLNTELGSRLFRSFVEVNPVAVSQNLTRVFNNKTEDELFSVKAGRRNLIWVLEKLCFDKRTFNDSVKLMYSFAVAENETWSSNATGQLLHLFNVVLPGTESTLEERLKIIEWGLQQDNHKFRELAIRAIKVGLNFGHFHRAGGAEQQGSKILIDFQPSFADIGRYWSALLSILWQQITLSNEFTDQSLDIVSSSSRGICRARHDELIIPILSKIAQYKNYDWNTGLNTLKSIRKFDFQHLTEHSQQDVNELIDKLTKNDFITRYKNAVTYFQYNTSGEFYSTEKMIEIVSQLADEFIDTNVEWDISLPLFYKKNQTYSFHFGKRIYERLKDNSLKATHFIDSSLQVINQISKDERDVSVLAGFLSDASEELRKYTYDHILAHADLTYLLFYLIASSKPKLSDFEILFSLIESERNTLNELLIFVNYFGFWNLEKEKIDWLFEKLSQFGKDGYTAFFIIVEHAFTQLIEQRLLLKSQIKRCFREIGIIRRFSGTMDQYGWFESLVLILKEDNENDFAKFVNQFFIDELTFKNNLYLDTDAQRLYELLLTKYFDTIWNDLSYALLGKNEKYEKFYCLKGILGSHIGGVGRSVGVLFEGDLNKIFQWCQNNSPLAVERIAEMVPIFSQVNNQIIPEWHPIAKRLIDEFGNVPDGLSGISTNMGNYSWTGSSVPLLEAKKQLFETLTNHRFQIVSDWATRNILYLQEEIKNEKIRDEELYL